MATTLGLCCDGAVSCEPEWAWRVCMRCACSSLAILSQGTPCKQTRPPLPRAARSGGRVDRPLGVALLARGLASVSRDLHLGLRYTGCRFRLSSPGAPFRAGDPRACFLDPVAPVGFLAPLGWISSMFISSLLVCAVLSHRRFFGMGCGVFHLAFRPGLRIGIFSLAAGFGSLHFKLCHCRES